MSNHLKTIDLARAVGLSSQQVRNYEAYGFLPPVYRSNNGYRAYSTVHLQALKTARNLISGYGWKNALVIMQAIHQNQLELVFALVDAQHAEIDRKRQMVTQTLDVIKTSAMGVGIRMRDKGVSNLRVGEVARILKIRKSTLHYWEERGLINPIRHPSSKYRLYDEHHLHQLQVIVILRDSGYDFDTLLSIMEEMATGKIERTRGALENRLHEIANSSKACIRSTASLWDYLKSILAEQHQESG